MDNNENSVFRSKDQGSVMDQAAVQKEDCRQPEGDVQVPLEDPKRSDDLLAGEQKGPVSKKGDTQTGARGAVPGQQPSTSRGNPDGLTSGQKRNRRRAEKKREQLAAKAAANSSGSSPVDKGGVKRPRSDNTTPSPSLALSTKRTRKNEGRTFADAVSLIKMAVVSDGHPSAKMVAEDETKIREDIHRRVGEMICLPAAERPQAPRVESITTSTSSILVNCMDEYTASWLKDSLDGNLDVIKGKKLKVIPAKDLPKPVKIAFKTRDTVLVKHSDLAARLDFFNPEFGAANWRLLQRQPESKTVRWIFEVDKEAATAIKRADLYGLTGTDRGIFKILNDPNVPVQEEKDVAHTSSPSKVRKSISIDSKDSVVLRMDELEVNSGSEGGSTVRNSPTSAEEEVLMASDGETSGSLEASTKLGEPSPLS